MAGQGTVAADGQLRTARARAEGTGGSAPDRSVATAARSAREVSVVKGYTVHLLFHLVAIVIGAAAGLAASLWWFGGEPTGLWLAIGALLIGVVLLALQLVYISRSEPPVPRYDPEDEEWDDGWDDGGNDARDESRAEPVSSTREDLEPVPESEVPQSPRQAPPSRTDEETKKKSARAALNEHWSSHPSTRRS